jgi:hypothetical protein
MNNKCINLRIRSRKEIRYGYCVKFKKEVSIFCKCKNIEYKQYKKIQKRTSKLLNLENNRYSIIYNDLTACAECGLKNGAYDYINNEYIIISKNEVFEGAYRQLSIKYGMVCPFCQKCHDRFHNDVLFNLEYKTMFQREFINSHSKEEFISIFKQDYIYKLEKIKIDTQF